MVNTKEWSHKHEPDNRATMNTFNTSVSIIPNRDGNHLNIPDSYLEIKFDVFADSDRC